MAAIPLLALLLLALAGSLKVAARAQASVALQARLDLCAVKLAVARERSLARLAHANRALRLTVWGIYTARGAKLAGPAGAVLGGASEAVLLRMNASLALLQDSELARGAATELSSLHCAADAWSRELAACLPSPPLASALRREATLFPDVKGALTHREEGRRLARFSCRGGKRTSTLEVRGSARLSGTRFNDAYVD